MCPTCPFPSNWFSLIALCYYVCAQGSHWGENYKAPIFLAVRPPPPLPPVELASDGCAFVRVVPRRAPIGSADCVPDTKGYLSALGACDRPIKVIPLSVIIPSDVIPILLFLDVTQ